jgi:hypothetical protein
MPTSREEIFEALFNLISAPAIFQTSARRLLHWTKVPAQPAIFLRPYKEDVVPSPTPQAFGLNPNYEMTAEAWIYCQNGDPNCPSGTQITDLLDLLDATMAANVTPQGRLTLGGLVMHCWREGETIVASGEPNTQSVAIVPINILVRDLIVPRPKVLMLSCNPANGVLTTGQSTVLTLTFNTGITVAGGTPSITLNSGGTAALTGATSGTALTFDYTVGANDTTANLLATGVALNGATITDQYGKIADLTIAASWPDGVLAINPPA